MFIDYLTLMLINMAAGLLILAWYIRAETKEIRDSNHANISINLIFWAPAFALPGIIALLTGLHMIYTWPLPGAFNMAFGELSVMFGGLFLAAAISLHFKYPLWPLGIYAALAGLASIVVGMAIIKLNMTLSPPLSGSGFILTGLSGLLIGIILLFDNKFLSQSMRIIMRNLGSILLALCAAIWMFIGYMAYDSHMDSLKNWVPAPMKSMMNE